MKWTIFAAISASPLVLAGAVRDISLLKRDNGIELAARMPMPVPKDHNDKSSNNGGSSTSTTEIIVIWENAGGSAATTTVNAAATATAGAAVATHTVTVGGSAGLVYTPDSISAAVGDMVVFTFESKNHTVTQSSFAAPCVAQNEGMNSGFVPNINNTITPSPQQAFQVLVDTPLWFYCAQQGHCGEGMVFSINPTANKTQAAFKAAAIAQNGTATTATTAGNSTTSASGSAVSSTATIASGTGTTNADGSCSCSCLCGVEAFPAGTQGLFAVGGMSGSMPQSALEISG